MGSSALHPALGNHPPSYWYEQGQRPSGAETPEDTALRKLLWFREGGEVSEKQWRDVVSVLEISGHKMDQIYLTSRASRLHVSDLLEHARS
jgi:hypothetical protein